MSKRQTKKLVFYCIFTVLIFLSAWQTRANQIENFLEVEPLRKETINNQQSSIKGDWYSVASVVDGDTIIVNIAGHNEKIRLIGINTPETVDPRKPVECYGREASNFAKKTLTNTKVLLEPDATQDERDKYGRLLRYVFLPDGTLFNRLMVEEGYAYEYTYQTPYKYQAEFKEAQNLAKSENKGLWNNEICPE